uniref:Reverse transcriptase n=1 Tax=Romanomermis culicivorax TaxID=13658 RepID=A0A915I065_ROMCU
MQPRERDSRCKRTVETTSSENPVENFTTRKNKKTDNVLKINGKDATRNRIRRSRFFVYFDRCFVALAGRLTTATFKLDEFCAIILTVKSIFIMRMHIEIKKYRVIVFKIQTNEVSLVNDANCAEKRTLFLSPKMTPLNEAVLVVVCMESNFTGLRAGHGCKPTMNELMKYFITSQKKNYSTVIKQQKKQRKIRWKNDETQKLKYVLHAKRRNKEQLTLYQFDFSSFFNVVKQETMYDVKRAYKTYSPTKMNGVVRKICN